MIGVLEISWYDAVGLAGVSLYIVAYFGVQIGHIDGNGLAYVCLNGLAATGLLLSTVGAFNLAAALVNGMFLLISLVGVWRISGEWRRAARDRRNSELAAAFEAATTGPSSPNGVPLAVGIGIALPPAAPVPAIAGAVQPHGLPRRRRRLKVRVARRG